jgi:haloacetate dehalogenase
MNPLALLDDPVIVTRLAVIDIAPTLDMYSATDMRFASAYYHWFHLIQPSPLPEQMILGCWKDYLHTKLGRWGGTGLGHLEPQALAEYERCFARPETIHAMCEDYRASASIDLEHDRASRAAGDKVACDMLVLWGQRGVVGALFDPLALWRAQCSASVRGDAMPAGHYIPEELPGPTAQRLQAFFNA